MNSKSLQDHNAQLAQKAKEIENLEELQAAQNENVEGLMDMIQSYVPGDGGDVGELNDYLNWDPSIQDFSVGVDGHSEVGDVDELFRGLQDPGTLGANVGDSVMGQILGTNPSTVAPSPETSSVGSRPREELEEDVEEVTPKRRRLG